MIPVFGIAGVVHKCAGEVQLFPQFQVQPEADCMEDGPRTVALCIERFRFHFVPVDVLGIPFPGEHVVDFVDGGYSKTVLVGKVKVERSYGMDVFKRVDGWCQSAGGSTFPLFEH